MKSKIYSSRYMKVSSKGMMWIPAFVTIGFLLAFPVAELIMLGNWFGMGYTTSEINALYANLWQDGFMLTGLAVAATAALFNGISQFWYLYSPRKIDFYHSLPVKRSRMFWHKTLQSLLYYLLPYLAMEFFSVCIGAMRGFFSLHLMKLAFLMMAFTSAFISALYFSGSLLWYARPSACELFAYCSGKPWTGAFCYSAVLRKSLLLYQQCRCLWLYKRLERKLAGTKYPCLHLCGKICRRKLWWHSGNCASGDNRFWRSWILCICKQKIRKNRYGLCFSILKTIIRFMIVVPGGLGIGLIFYMLPSDNSRIVWWIFGLIFGTLLSGGIMGIIYYRDFLKIFSNKIQFVVSGACVAFVACMFLFDLTGYDNYIPSYDKIENIAAEFTDGGGWENTYSVEINEDGKISTQDSGYYRNGDLLGNNLGISPDIYACVEQIVKENKVICRSLSEDSDNRALWNGDIWDSSNDTSRLQMRYDLKSGKTVYRSYMVSTENQKNLYKEGYAEGTLKSERYSILKLDDKYVDEVRCDFITGESISLFQDNKAKRQLLVDAFRQDVEEADPEVLTGEPCASLNIEYSGVPSAESVDAMVPGQNRRLLFLRMLLCIPAVQKDS